MTFNPIEHYGMYGMTKAELQELARKNVASNYKAMATRRACERMIFFKRMTGQE